MVDDDDHHDHDDDDVDDDGDMMIIVMMTMFMIMNVDDDDDDNDDVHDDVSGLEDWGEDAVLHQVLAASHQEYLDSLKTPDGAEKEDSGEPSAGKSEDQHPN